MVSVGGNVERESLEGQGNNAVNVRSNYKDDPRGNYSFQQISQSLQKTSLNSTYATPFLTIELMM